jgi:hypothetical protein
LGWYRRKHRAVSPDIEQPAEETTQVTGANNNIEQKNNASSIILNRDVIESMCPSSHVEMESAANVNVEIISSNEEKAFITSQGKAQFYNRELGDTPSQERLGQFGGNSSETDLEWREICAICLEEYSPQDYYRKLPCGHTFHTECVDTWFANAVKVEQIACPTCKADYSKTFEARLS